MSGVYISGLRVKIPELKAQGLGSGLRVSGGGRLLHRNVQRFRGGLVCKAHRLLYHSTLGLRVITKKKKSTFLGPFIRTVLNVWDVSRRRQYPQRWTFVPSFFRRAYPFQHSGVVGASTKATIWPWE